MSNVRLGVGAGQEGHRSKRKGIVRSSPGAWAHRCEAVYLGPLRHLWRLEGKEDTPKQGRLWSISPGPQRPWVPEAYPHPGMGLIQHSPTKASRWQALRPKAGVLPQWLRKCFPLSPSRSGLSKQLGVWCTEVLPEGPTVCALQVSFLSCMFWHWNTVGMSLSVPIWLY